MPAKCRHCGKASEVDATETPDWFCKRCDHWQDTIACPTCGQPARISLLSPEALGLVSEESPPEDQPEGGDK